MLVAPREDYDRMKKDIWNKAIEECIKIVSPVPHVEEERSCQEVAEQLKGLKIYD